MVWFSPGTTSVTSPVPAQPQDDKLYDYKGLISFCIDHCRKMIFETYAIKTSTVIDSNYDAFDETLATRLHKLQLGANEVSMAGVGVGNTSAAFREQDRDVCDLAPYNGTCNGTNKGGLEEQFNRMQAKGSYADFWRGVGFFALGAVGPSWPSSSVWSKKDFAHYLRLRTSRWVGK